MKESSFDKQRLDRLKLAYQNAVLLGQDSFWFDGCEYLTSYAMYVIEYMKCKLETNGKEEA